MRLAAVAAIFAAGATAWTGIDAGANADRASCAANLVRYQAAKHPTLGDMPWVLARPMAPGIFAFVPFYPQMLRDGRVNRSDGLVLWKIGTRIVWSATGEVVAQRLDGRGRFRVALAAGDGGAAFEPSFPSTGCWRLTLLAGSARVSATVDVPAPGCWLFRLRTGRVAGVLVVRAIDRR